MAEIYTHHMYYKFEDEMCFSLNYKIQFIRETDNQRVYKIQRKKIEGCKVRELVYDKEMDFISCVCKKFESAGIPCKHIIAYLMRFDDVDLLPKKYILKRWTKSAKSGTVVDDKGVHRGEDKSYALKRSHLMQSSSNVVNKALVHEGAIKIYTDGLHSISEQIDQFLGSAIGNNPINSNPIQTGCSANGCNTDKNYNELDLVRAKGCGKRLKGGKEKALAKSKQRKSRRCNGCGKEGQSHDKRNCPELMNRLSTSKDANLEEENGFSTEDGEDGDDICL